MAEIEVAEPGVGVVEVTKTEDACGSPWTVVVYNDPVNLMSYVTMVIRKIFGYDEAKAQAMMLDVHQKGKAIVWNGEREKAEFYVQQLQGYQLLAAMRKAGE
ncbi:MAG: ATP-dependent Clp protease adapter ClpS [Verrucomicrobiales bacterium]|nr:ATP-dependent Clp protease adapter ClpS [Verrucomicrobiales bacterium]